MRIVARAVDKKRVKIAVKVVDIFGNHTMTIVDVSLKRWASRERQ